MARWITVTGTHRRASPQGPDDDPVVRPFIVTGGRTRPADERLRVETLITAVPGAYAAGGYAAASSGFERGRIVQICRRPRSVAEVANVLGVPVGVARVLIADLLAERAVTVHEHVGGPAEQLPLALLERIREGIRAL